MPRNKHSWETFNRKKLVNKSRREFKISMADYNKVIPRTPRRGKSPTVSEIHWVKETPRSMAIRFLEWRAKV